MVQLLVRCELPGRLEMRHKQRDCLRHPSWGGVSGTLLCMADLNRHAHVRIAGKPFLELRTNLQAFAPVGLSEPVGGVERLSLLKTRTHPSAETYAFVVYMSWICFAAHCGRQCLYPVENGRMGDGKPWSRHVSCSFVCRNGFDKCRPAVARMCKSPAPWLAHKNTLSLFASLKTYVAKMMMCFVAWLLSSGTLRM